MSLRTAQHTAESTGLNPNCFDIFDFFFLLRNGRRAQIGIYYFFQKYRKHNDNSKNSPGIAALLAERKVERLTETDKKDARGLYLLSLLYLYLYINICMYVCKYAYARYQPKNKYSIRSDFNYNL